MYLKKDMPLHPDIAIAVYFVVKASGSVIVYYSDTVNNCLDIGALANNMHLIPKIRLVGV